MGIAVCFSDGEIRGVSSNGDQVELHFMALAGDEGEHGVVMRFHGAGDLRVADEALGARVEREKLTGGRRWFRRTTDRSTLTLFDDDDEELFHVEFDRCEVLRSDAYLPVVVSEGGTLEFYVSTAAVEHELEHWVADDATFEFFCANGSRLRARDVGGRLVLEHPDPSEDGSDRLRQLLLAFFAKHGPHFADVHRELKPCELVALGLRTYPGQEF